MIYVQFHAYFIQLDHWKVILGIHDHIGSIQALQVKTNLDQLNLVQSLSRLFNLD